MLAGLTKAMVDLPSTPSLLGRNLLNAPAPLRYTRLAFEFTAKGALERMELGPPDVNLLCFP